MRRRNRSHRKNAENKRYLRYCGKFPATGGAPLSKEKFNFPLGVVVGNEGGGISKEVLALGKGVEIEMSKNVESLNAGVAGSILMSYCYNKFKNLKGENR